MSTPTPIWNKHFHQQSAIFSPLLHLCTRFDCNNDWPDIDEYNQLISEVNGEITNHSGLKIRFIPQLTQQAGFETQYEPLIYRKGLVQTRTASWHDFFQVLAWSIFPNTKSYLNALHYQASLERYQKNPDDKQRSKLENFVTLFDECGAVIIYSDPRLKTIVKNFEWRDLFLGNREAFGKKLECIMFGHAMYEKAIKPYIGMTSHVLFLHQPESFFSLQMPDKLSIIDEALNHILRENRDWTTKDLNPFPVLGVPGWYVGNEQPSFYNNTNYFRKKST